MGRAGSCHHGSGMRRVLHRQRVHDRHVLVLRLVGQGGQLRLRARDVHRGVRPRNGFGGIRPRLRQAVDDGDSVDRRGARHDAERRVVRAERRVPRLPRQLHVLRQPERHAHRLQDAVRSPRSAHTPRILDPQARRVGALHARPFPPPRRLHRRVRVARQARQRRLPGRPDGHPTRLW